MTRYSAKPGLSIMVSIEKPIVFPCTPIVLNLTLESIYNIPEIMNNEMEYHICLKFPSTNEVSTFHYSNLLST